MYHPETVNKKEMRKDMQTNIIKSKNIKAMYASKIGISVKGSAILFIGKTNDWVIVVVIFLSKIYQKDEMNKMISKFIVVENLQYNNSNNQRINQRIFFLLLILFDKLVVEAFIKL